MLGRNHEFEKDGRIQSLRDRSIGDIIVDVLAKGGSVHFDRFEMEGYVRITVHSRGETLSMCVTDTRMDGHLSGAEFPLRNTLHELDRRVYG